MWTRRCKPGNKSGSPSPCSARASWDGLQSSADVQSRWGAGKRLNLLLFVGSLTSDPWCISGIRSRGSQSHNCQHFNGNQDQEEKIYSYKKTHNRPSPWFKPQNKIKASITNQLRLWALPEWHGKLGSRTRWTVHKARLRHHLD